MKRTITLLSIAVSVSTTGAIAQTPAWMLGGQFRLRNDHKQLDHSSLDHFSKDAPNTIQMRARLNLTAKINDDLLFHFSPQATKYYGQLISPQNSADKTTDVNSSGDKYHSAVNLFEAYAQGKRGKVEYKLGRQALAYGDYIVLGSRNWTAGAMAFDAMKFTVPVGGSSKLDIVYSTISQGSDAASANDDTTLTFLYFKAIEEQQRNLDFYVIDNDNRQSDNKTMSYGFRYKGKVQDFDYRTENIAQNDIKHDKIEHNLNLELGYKLSHPLRAYVGFAQASENYNQLYVNRHKYNGVIDIVGRKNLNTYELGMTYQQSSKLDFKFQYFTFSQKHKNVGVYNASVTNKLIGDSSKSQIGNEIDFFVNYKLSDYEKLQFSVSEFKHGDYFTSGESTSNFIYLQYLLKI